MIWSTKSVIAGLRYNPIANNNETIAVDKGGDIWYDPRTRHELDMKFTGLGWGLMGSGHIRVEPA